jgi:deoxyribodipyrimidine photolyase-related protein
LPATTNDSTDLWEWAKNECSVEFGPYEDAMSVESSNLFHTRISSLVNIHRLLPEQVLHEALSLDLPLNSKEGFVRQVLGWREFMRHVHRVTRGFREVPQNRIQVLPQPADGGYRRWSGRKWKLPPCADQFDGGAAPSELGSSNPLPPAFWGKPSGLNCLDCVVSDVWKEGYSHHITRLMILSNIATLLDISPRELTDWFWIAYTDAYDWVVEPNVLGMGTFALGNLFTTKPYVSGSAYINRMSDYCCYCRFNPKKDCPIARWYWSFLARHYEKLSQNPRIGPVLRSLQRRSREQIDEDQKYFEVALTILEKGEPLSPKLFD